VKRKRGGEMARSGSETGRVKTSRRVRTCGVGTVVMKNCEPLVLRPAFAMLSSPGRVCRWMKFSSVWVVSDAWNGSPRRVEGRRTSKLLPKDTLPPRPIPARKVPALEHERRDNPVERTPPIPKPMLHRRQLAEVLRRARYLCVVQLEHDAPAWRRVNVNVELAHVDC
jgi:hypothetical protein